MSKRRDSHLNLRPGIDIWRIDERQLCPHDLHIPTHPLPPDLPFSMTSSNIQWPIKDVCILSELKILQNGPAESTCGCRTDSVFKIIYTSIVGVVMVMACVEWFLWLAAFTYCLIKVFRKAEHWSINLLCIVVGFAFVLMRYTSV